MQHEMYHVQPNEVAGKVSQGAPGLLPGIDGFRSIFSLATLEGITSPCCLLIGQYPHHMTHLPSSFYGERCYGIRLF